MVWGGGGKVVGWWFVGGGEVVGWWFGRGADEVVGWWFVGRSGKWLVSGLWARSWLVV